MKPQRLFYILLITWVMADLLVAIFTPMHADEAYYALYGRHLDWGYYDHPPMVALLTAASSALFKGNLSIRFLTVLLHGGTVWLIWKTIAAKSPTRRDVLTFFAVAASLVMFSVYGFVTTPDAPLLFFTALFFLLYKHYLDKPGWPLALALGVTLAAMLYSKYMAVLVLGFVVLSNPKLLKDPKAWMAVFVAASLFIPHIHWQFQNDFPSLQYHLADRSKQFRLRYPLEYIPNQLLVFNPVCLGIALWLCWQKRHSKHLFERAEVFTIAGFILFFWIMTIRGHTEPHWTAAASFPMIILLYNELRKPKWRKWLMYGVVPVTALLLVGRIALPVLGSEKIHLFGRQAEMVDIGQYCGDTPAVFTTSFQDPSLYTFYNGKEATVISSFYSRRTQFDLWQSDLALQGKQVCLIGEAVTKRPIPSSEIIRTPHTEFAIRKVESFQGANRLSVTVKKCRVVGNTLYLNMTIHNPYSLDYHFDNPDFPTSLLLGFVRDDEYKALFCPATPDLVIPAGGDVTISQAVSPAPDFPFVVCVDNSVCRSVNSKPVKSESRN